MKQKITTNVIEEWFNSATANGTSAGIVSMPGYSEKVAAVIQQERITKADFHTLNDAETNCLSMYLKTCLDGLEGEQRERAIYRIADSFIISLTVDEFATYWKVMKWNKPPTNIDVLKAMGILK